MSLRKGAMALVYQVAQCSTYQTGTCKLWNGARLADEAQRWIECYLSTSQGSSDVTLWRCNGPPQPQFEASPSQ
jgi:hypothetical protein